MSTESRTDRLADEFFDERQSPDSDDELSDEQIRATAELSAETIVEKENMLFWSLYSVLEDASQADVKDLVDPAAETSQSTVSRIIRDKETAILHDEDSLDAVHGGLHEDDLDLYPDEWLDAYREMVAEVQAEREALRLIAGVDSQTPEWAARRYPRLVGCHHYKAERLPVDVDIADDSHLNRLDSVNTDRWK